MKPVLVDTSICRHHFGGNLRARGLGHLLDEYGVVLVHPLVAAELVLGGLSRREEQLLEQLPAAAMVAHGEVLAMVRARRLARRGIGWVDAHLLASALASSALIWSADGALTAVASELILAFRPGAMESI